MGKNVLIFILLITYAAFAAPEQITKQDFKTVQVAERVFAFIASESNTGIVQGNVVLIVGDTSAMIVDSGQYPSLASRMADKILELTKNPVKLIVNTHWHGDHLLSNYVFKERFPGIMVLAHAETVKNGDKFYEKFPEQVKGYPKLIETLRKISREGKTEKGRILTEEEKKGFSMDADALEANLQDLTASRYEPAELTFEKEVTYDLGKRNVRILYLGRANTSGDALVFIPDAGILITGDTVVHPTPYSFGSYHSEWIEVLKKMMNLGAKIYIPGHGEIMRDTSYIQTLIALLEDTRSQVRAAVNEDLTLEQVRERVKLEDWKKRLSGNNAYRQRAFHEYYLRPGIERAYKEAKGEPLSE